MKNVTVFCGSSKGTEGIYEEHAYLLGKALADLDIGVVYGGTKIGLMGAVANGALEHGGRVIGVLPYFLQAKEIAHDALTELILVDTMHERKTKMNQLCDGVIALPGGFGTMEEFFEMLTWAQLGLHDKPMGLLNVNGFYDELIAFVQVMVNKGFLKEVNRDMILYSSQIYQLLEQMNNYRAPVVPKWITKATT